MDVEGKRSRNGGAAPNDGAAMGGFYNASCNIREGLEKSPLRMVSTPRPQMLIELDFKYNGPKVREKNPSLAFKLPNV